jgi:HK97 family phage major capsid protein
MKKFYALFSMLKTQGFASVSQKAEFKASVEELGDEAKTVATEVAEVEALPEEAPVVTDEEKEAEAVVEKLFTKTSVRFEKDLGGKMDSKLAIALKAMQEDLTAFAKKALSVKTLKSVLSFDMETYKKFASNIKSKQSSFTIEMKDFDLGKIKEAGDISIDGNITGELPQAELDTRVSRDPQRAPFIQELVSVGTISSNLDAWIETTGEDGDPLPVAELAKLSAKDYDYARRTAEVKKIGVYSKYSVEMAEDLPNLISEVKNNLVVDLKRVVDTQLLNGNGEYDELTGILKNAVNYNAGSFAGTVKEANRFDVIETAVSQVITALHMPNVVCVNPTDVAKMNLTKNTNGTYVLPPFITAGGQTISGVRVVANTGITAGKFLVGDFSKSTVKYRKGLTIEMANTDADDFTHDRFTVKATVRLVHRVRENDYEAFVYGDFSTAIASLELGS